MPVNHLPAGVAKLRWQRPVWMILALMAWPVFLHAQQHALLIGVSEYRDPRSNLNGPRNDVALLEQYLQRQWPQADIRKLVDTQATKANILRELETLVRRIRPDDQVFIYFSGHGTSKYDHHFARKHGLPIAHGSGAFVPHDAQLDGDSRAVMASLVIGNRDLQPRLKQIDRLGVETLVVMDACYSGNSVRSLTGKGGTRPRYLPVIIRDPPSARGSLMEGELDDDLIRQAPPPYPYNNIAYLSAASDSEVAQDINDPSRTLDGKAHGAFSDALLRILAGQLEADSDGDGRISNAEIRLASTRYLEAGGYGHTPQPLPPPEEDAGQLRNRALFRAPGKGPASAAAPRDEVLRIALGAGLEPLAQLIGQEPGMVLDVEGAAVHIQQQGGQWLLRAAGGDPIGTVNAGDSARALFRLRQLGWINRLGALQRQNPFQLELDVAPGNRGNNFLFGEFLTFRLALGKSAWLVLLDIDSEGKVIPLYPFQPHEAAGPVPSGKGLYVPYEDPKRSICAQPPEGTDHLIALAFKERPAFLDRLLGKTELGSDDPALASWKALLEQENSPVSVRVTKLRVIKGEGKACPN